MLTPKQKKLLEFIKDFIKQKGYSPSYREIAKELKINSTSTIHHYIQSLKQKGYLEAYSKPRTLKPYDVDLEETIKIPLLGYVSAGSPIQVFEYKDFLLIPKKMITEPKGKLFALKVMGDSMIEEGIFDGDYIICQRNITPKNGDNVIAYLPETGEVVLKKFYKRKNYIELVPRNKKLKPIKTKNIEIQGIVKAIIRRY